MQDQRGLAQGYVHDNISNKHEQCGTFAVICTWDQVLKICRRVSRSCWPACGGLPVTLVKTTSRSRGDRDFSNSAAPPGPCAFLMAASADTSVGDAWQRIFNKEQMGFSSEMLAVSSMS